MGPGRFRMSSFDCLRRHIVNGYLCELCRCVCLCNCNRCGTIVFKSAITRSPGSRTAQHMSEETSALSFRMTTRNRNIASSCTPFFATLGVVSSWTAATSIDGAFANPGAAAYYFGTLWGAFTMLGMYLMVSYYRYSLRISPTEICQVLAFSRTTLSIQNVSEIEWKQRPQRGSVVLHCGSTKMKIILGNLTDDDRRKVITVLQQVLSSVPHQVGWHKFAGPWWSSI